MTLEYGPVEIAFLTFLSAILASSLVLLVVVLIRFFRGDGK